MIKLVIVLNKLENNNAEYNGQYKAEYNAEFKESKSIELFSKKYDPDDPVVSTVTKNKSKPPMTLNINVYN